MFISKVILKVCIEIFLTIKDFKKAKQISESSF